MTGATVGYREVRYGDGGPPTTVPELVPVASGRLAVACYPNPCNPRTTVEVTVPESVAARAAAGARLEVAVFDLQGRRVATLVRDMLPEGRHGVTWDGRDDAGRAVASGVYLVHAGVGEISGVGRVVVVR